MAPVMVVATTSAQQMEKANKVLTSGGVAARGDADHCIGLRGAETFHRGRRKPTTAQLKPLRQVTRDLLSKDGGPYRSRTCNQRIKS